MTFIYSSDSKASPRCVTVPGLVSQRQYSVVTSNVHTTDLEGYLRTDRLTESVRLTDALVSCSMYAEVYHAIGSGTICAPPLML